MKKLLIALGVVVGVVVLLSVGVMIFASTALASIIQEGVESEGSRIIGTPVKLTRVEISPLSGKGAVRGPSIANPEGFSSKNLLQAKSVEVGIDPWSVLDREGTVTIHEVVIDQAELTFEFQRLNTNIGAIKEHIDLASEAEGETESGSPRKIIIERFLLKGAKVHIVIDGKRRTHERALNVPDIELHDIGKATNGALARDAARQIFAALGQEVSSLVKRTPGPWQELREKIRERREERGEGGGVREKMRQWREKRGESGGLIQKIRERREQRRQHRPAAEEEP